MARSTLLSKFIRTAVRKTPSLPHFEGREPFIRLDLNESAGLIPPVLYKEIGLDDPYVISSYPGYHSLKKSLSKYAKVSTTHLCVVNGSDDAIPKIAELFFDKGDRVVVPVPTFQTYYRALTLREAQLIPIPYEMGEEIFRFPMKGTLEALKKKTSGLIICNPANPMGSTISMKDLIKLARATKTKGVPFIVDEAYFEYGNGTTAVSLLAKYPHIIVFRSFSKAFGLAGLRLGYVIAHPDVIAQFHKLTLPWQVNHVATNTGLVVLKHTSLFKRARGELKRRKANLERVFTEHGKRVFRTETNFVLAEVGDADAFAKKAHHKGVLVKSLAGYAKVMPILRKVVRVAIPGKDTEKRALIGLKSALKSVRS